MMSMTCPCDISDDASLLLDIYNKKFGGKK